MKSLIKQDSYWYVEGEEDDENAKMMALCVICATKQNKGWLWKGEMGYGDYDLFCASCKNAIHIRENNEAKANNQGQ
jgi:hypothetical protein